MRKLTIIIRFIFYFDGINLVSFTKVLLIRSYIKMYVKREFLYLIKRLIYVVQALWVFVEPEPNHVKHFFSSDVYGKHCYCDTLDFGGKIIFFLFEFIIVFILFN